MILADVRHYLESRGRATLADIATRLDADPRAVQGMLEQWIRKGRVRRFRPGDACGGGCTLCDAQATEVYEWIHTPGESWREGGPACAVSVRRP